YEQLRGTLRCAVDPKHPDHQVITDLDLAPTEADGRVHFSADFLLLKPVNPAPNGTLLCDVLNRANRTILRMFDNADAHPGEPAATLIGRDHPDAPPTPIDRARWRFARADGAPDANYIALDSGFQPGLVYELTYTTVGAPVIGLGFLAFRDCASFLRYGTEAE